MVEHDHAGIALTHLVGGRARQQFVMISEAGDHQCAGGQLPAQALVDQEGADGTVREPVLKLAGAGHLLVFDRSEEHTSELQSLMRISYAVLCLKTKTTT